MKTNFIMIMTLKIRVLFLIFLMALGLCAPVLAQSCTPEYEVITALKDPQFGAYSLWDTVYGDEENSEELNSVLALESGNVVVAGIKSYEITQNVGPTLPGKRLVIAEIDKRGRMVWVKETLINDLIAVHKILPADDEKGKGYLVLISAGLTNAKTQARLLFLDAAGKILREKNIGEDGSNLLPRDMALAWDGKSYVMVASVSKQGAASHAQFYHIDKVGGILTQRSYQLGVNTILLGISRSDKDFYVATGHTQDTQNQQNAWVVKLNKDGEIIWQRQYKRGRGARLMSAADLGSAGVIVAGQALSVTDQSSAGWVMMLRHSDGNTIWQRFYTGKQHNTAMSVVTDSVNAISVLMNSKAPDQNDNNMEDEFVRLLTLNSRGLIQDNVHYYNSNGVIASQLVLGADKARVVAGKTQTLYRKEAKLDAKEPQTAHASLEGWAFSAPAPVLKDDICAVQPVMQKTESPVKKSTLDAESVFE